MIDAIRHISIFDPDLFAGKRVDVIGAGAIGSRVILALAKLGISNIHVWDFDTVAAHNIANQVFGNDDVGKLKVDAVAELVERQTGTVITKHPVKVEGGEPLGPVVFVLPDTMDSRKTIFEKSLRYRPSVALMIEVRMGTDNGRVYAINPCEPAQVKYWEGTLYTDAEAEVSACGTALSVGATADVLSGLATWYLIRWFAYASGVADTQAPEWSTIIGLRPNNMLVGAI